MPWGAWALAGAAIAAAALVLAAWNPGDGAEGTVCVFRRLTHHDCATCGLTRAFAHLARGDWRGAAARHPLALPLAAEIALAWLAAPLAFARGLRWRDAWTTRVAWAHVAAFVGVWLVRLAVAPR